MDCVLHIGIGKAGSSSLQAVFQEHRDQLAERGVLYPKDLLPAGKSGGDNSKCLAVSCMRSQRTNFVLQQHRVTSPEARARFDTQVDKLYRDQIADFEGKLCLLSAEHFWSCLPHASEVETLATKLRNFGLNVTRVIVYLRRQSDWFESFLHQRLREGRGLLELTARSLLASPSAKQIDYAALLGTWGEAFPDAEIVPRIFARGEMEGGNIVSDFCAAAGITPIGHDAGLRNASSVSNAGINAMLAMRRKFEAAQDPRLDSRAWRSLTACIAQYFPGSCALLPEDELRAIDRFYQTSNETVCERFFPARPTLFSTAYPNRQTEAFHACNDASFQELADFTFAMWLEREFCSHPAGEVAEASA